MKRRHHPILILGIIISLLNLVVCPGTKLTQAKPAQRNLRPVLQEGLLDKMSLSSFPGRRMVPPHAEETEFEPLPALVPAGITFTVNSTADPGTGGCDLSECTLREAITAANAAAGADNISFNIPGGGVKTITPTSFLPSITSPVVLDGYTQPGASSNTLPDNDNAVLMIVVDLSAAGGGGISISAGSSTVRGLVINHGGNSAISMDTNGNNIIEGNFIGTNAAGATDTTPALGTANGVLVQFGSSNNIIGGTTPAARNLISNNSAGVALFGGTGNLVQGNFIGTDRTGSADLGNGTGISISVSTNNTIGGTTPGARNVISGNTTGISVGAANTIIQGNYIGVNATGGAFTGNGGLAIFVGSSGTVIGGTTPASRNVISGHSIGIGLNTAASTTVQGNFIGTDAAGVVPLGNSNIGLSIANSCNNSLIGGTSPGAGNVISANGTGIFFNSGASTGVTVQGNLIGTDANGTADLGNATVGINVSTPEVGLVIGGSNSAARNVISGNNSIGLFLASSGSTVQGNLIGTAIDGSSPLGNGSFGIQVPGSNNQIGGTAAGTANVIAFNGDAGVSVASGTNNALRHNSIYSNATLGIDLATTGITANDLCDTDASANLQQNFPILNSAVNSGGVTTIQGTLNSTASTAFTIDFYSNSSCDASGYGEGQIFLGSTTVNTDGSCNANINVSLPVTLAPGAVVTATATDPQGNTSEFSQCAQAVGMNPPLANNDSFSTNEDTALNVAAPGVLLNDTDADPGTTLTAQLFAGPSNGTLSLNQNGSFIYTPAANFNGTDSFTYRASDGTNTSNTATVQITINPVNDQPVADAQSVTTNEDTARAIMLTGSDVEGGALTYSVVTGPTQGSLSGTAPNLTYTPAANYNGADSFTFKVNDGQLDSNVATVSITINAVNDAPIANDQSATTDEDTARAITLTASDVDGDTLTFSIVTGPAHGILSGTGASRTYTPAANYNGTDTFTFKVNDGTVDSNIANVSLTITTVNDAPLAIDDSYNTAGNSTLTVPVPGVLGNDTDVEGNALTAILVSSASNGTLSFNPNGSFTYTPHSNTSGTDSFTYRANDGSADSNVAAVTITVTAAPTPTPTPTPATVQFSQSSYSIVEACTSLPVTITRSGDISGTATVEYQTADGTATRTMDYNFAAGRLSFAPFETSKTIYLLINDDAKIEGTEELTISLSNPSGGTLGTPSTATIQILDNNPESTTNVIDNYPTFICQQYHDFLNRDPEPGPDGVFATADDALQFYLNIINNYLNTAPCTPGDIECNKVIRGVESANFLRSPEFQRKGNYVMFLYMVSIGQR
ncbi:MAG TPA: Ig-like domain-containing protein, partial [Pyrinomonadaceae bacterium]